MKGRAGRPKLQFTKPMARHAIKELYFGKKAVVIRKVEGPFNFGHGPFYYVFVAGEGRFKVYFTGDVKKG